MVVKKENGIFIREVSVRYKRKRVSKKTHSFIGENTSSPDRVVKIFYRDMQKETVEKFLVIHLNNQNIIESFQAVSIGTLNSASVCNRDVFKAAVVANSAAIICIHNHPSGNCMPSPEDRKITEELKAAGRLLGIKVLDHIIIGKGSYYSFNAEYKSHVYI